MFNNSDYSEFSLGNFTFKRDRYFATVKWPGGEHIISIDDFLRAIMRDVAWDFFYGVVNFDHVVGTCNYYGKVELFAGKYHSQYKKLNRHYSETHELNDIKNVFMLILENWCTANFDPFAAPQETIAPWHDTTEGPNKAIHRKRVVAQRMVGLPGDAKIRRCEEGFPINRHFLDVDQEEPCILAEPGFEKELGGFNLFSYLSRSDVTWNPSVCSVVKDSLFCPTTEEHKLPIIHGNDRVEWFIQLSDEITWNIEDKETGEPLAKITMKPGDVAAMPANIRHQGYSPKRSMLLVWENGSPSIPELIRKGKAPTNPVDF